MKKALIKLIIWTFNDFKLTRKKTGGIWYYVQVEDSGSGMAGPIKYWTRKTPIEGEEVLKTESY